MDDKRNYVESAIKSDADHLLRFEYQSETDTLKRNLMFFSAVLVASWAVTPNSKFNLFIVQGDLRHALLGAIFLSAIVGYHMYLYRVHLETLKVINHKVLIANFYNTIIARPAHDAFSEAVNEYNNSGNGFLHNYNASALLGSVKFKQSDLAFGFPFDASMLHETRAEMSYEHLSDLSAFTSIAKKHGIDVRRDGATITLTYEYSLKPEEFELFNIYIKLFHIHAKQNFVYYWIPLGFGGAALIITAVIHLIYPLTAQLQFF